MAAAPPCDPATASAIGWPAPVSSIRKSLRPCGHFAKSRSSAKGAEAAVAFEGTGAIVVGTYTAQSGQADIYLDGKQIATVDAYQDGERGVKAQEGLWHGFDLRPSRHTIRVVVRGEPFAGSQGSEIGIEDLVVYRK